MIAFAKTDAISYSTQINLLWVEHAIKINNYNFRSTYIDHYILIVITLVHDHFYFTRCITRRTRSTNISKLSSTLLSTGSGYHLTVVKLPGCNSDAIIAMVKNYVTGVTVDSDENSELALLLPQGTSGALPMLFKEIKERQESLKIRSYGVSVTTMEEVFVRCGRSSTFCPV